MPWNGRFAASASASSIWQSAPGRSVPDLNPVSASQSWVSRVLVCIHRASHPVSNVQAFTDRNNHRSKLRQVFDGFQIAGNLAGMRQRIIRQKDHIRFQFGKKNCQLRWSANAIGVKENRVERPLQTADHFGCIPKRMSTHPSKPAWARFWRA